MTSLREFFSLPMDARGPQHDRQVGFDELGRPVYAGQLGNQYTQTEQPRGNAFSEFMDRARNDPWQSTKDIARSLVQGAWNGVEAPGNALRGIPQTYGDVADTALDWGVFSAAGTAPQGAIRAGPSRNTGVTPEFRNSVLDAHHGQMDLTTSALMDGVPVGRVDYSVYENIPRINMIEVDPAFRRQGIATRLLEDLQSRYPDAEIDWGSLTSDGSALYNSTQFRHVDQTGGIDQIMPIIENRYRAAEAEYLATFRDGFAGDAASIRENFYRLEDELEAAREMASRPPLRLIEPTRNSSGASGVDNSGISVGNIPAGGPETPAQSIARLLREDPSQITDDMLGALTPNDNMELARLYDEGATGMPMPMDEASRMARAREMGFDEGAYHGSSADVTAFRTDMGRGARHNTGLFSASNPANAETYAPNQGGTVYPLIRRGESPIVSADMQNWNRIESPVYALDRSGPDWQDIELIDEFGEASTNDIATAARREGLPAITVGDVSDRGPYRHGFRDYPTHGTVNVDFDPTNIRSRFARFDPRLRHLANLSAGIGAGAVMLPQENGQTSLENLQAYIRGQQ